MYLAFKKYIEEQELLKSDDRVLLAVSGGIDSMVMATLFLQYFSNHAAQKMGIAHCNFQLRGDESDGDEAFVRELAAKNNISFYHKAFDTEPVAASAGVSIQMAARDLRYQWFDEIAYKNGYTKIALAHHGDDELETMLINLVRGTGLSGLHGILPVQGNKIRPLLFTNRTAIEQFAREKKLAWREDSSNRSDKYIRNKLRHNVVPILKELNPQIEETMHENAARIRRAELIFNEYMEQCRSKLINLGEVQDAIFIDQLMQLQPLDSYLFELLRPYRFNYPVVLEIIAALHDNNSGKVFYSESHRLLKDRNELIIAPLKQGELPTLNIHDQGGDLVISPALKMHMNTIKNGSGLKVPRSSYMAWLDKAKLQFPLTLRKWQPGDTFYPLGMRGKKKLSDFLIDEKVTLFQKETVQVLVSGEEVVWVLGMRISDRYKITDATREIFVCELREE